MESPNTLAELHKKLVALAGEWRNISETYDASSEEANRVARSLVTASARQVFLSFGPLALAIVEALGRERFPATIPDPPEFVFNPVDLQQAAFGTKDPVEAGQLAILWAAATRKEWQLGVRRNFRLLVERWAASLAFSFSGGVTGEWRVYSDVMSLALLAFNKLANAQLVAADAQQNEPPIVGPFVNAAQVDLKGERFRRLHTQFLDYSQRYRQLRYLAATGDKTCPEWPEVPHPSLPANHVGLAKAHWIEITGKRPGSVFAPITNTQWLQVEGRLWQGAFYFDGREDNPTKADHDSLKRQYVELQGAIEQFHLLATEAAGFLDTLPPVYPPLVYFPSEPDLSHR